MPLILKRALLAVIVIFALMQFSRPARENPASDPSMALAAHVEVPADVATLLTDCCSDCHSNDTAWPWYSNVAPVSWLVARHVEEGREHLNLSEWGAYTPYRAQHKLEEMAEEVKEGEMPLKVYLPAHPEAKLDSDQRERLADWANAERAKILATIDPAELEKERQKKKH